MMIDIVVVGAGMAGLTAASELKASGFGVVVVEASEDVGGRLASRRIGDAVFDVGAQFITARDPRFVAAINDWREDGVLTTWFDGSGDEGVGHPRYRGVPTMQGLARHLARGLDVRLAQPVRAVQRSRLGWDVVPVDGDILSARAVVLTPPVPLSIALLEAGGYELSQAVRSRLDKIEYDRCIAVMAAPEAPAQIPEPGGLAPDAGPIGWLTDNQKKGISATPAVTLHGTAAFSLEHAEADPRESAEILLHAAEPWLTSSVKAFAVRSWRYSKVVGVEPIGHRVVSEEPPLLLAGDAFVAARVEGAARSGWSAADAVARMVLPRQR